MKENPWDLILKPKLLSTFDSRMNFLILMNVSQKRKKKEKMERSKKKKKTKFTFTH